MIILKLVKKGGIRMKKIALLRFYSFCFQSFCSDKLIYNWGEYIDDTLIEQNILNCF